MKAPRNRIDLWIQVAKTTENKYIISVADMFSYKYDPIFCADEQTVLDTSVKYMNNDDKIINEIIRINGDGSITEELSVVDIKCSI